MDRDNLMDEIFCAIYEVGSKQYAKQATDSLMKKIDTYVEVAVTKARLEIMKNYGVI